MATKQFIGATHNTSSAATYTFDNQSFGDPHPGRKIVVTISARKGGTSGQLSTVTIGGVQAQLYRINNTNDGNCQIGAVAVAGVPEGASGTIVIGFNEAYLRVGIGVYRVTDANPTIAGGLITTQERALAAELQTVYGGVTIGTIGNGGSNSGGNNFSWTQLNEDFDITYVPHGNHSAASAIEIITGAKLLSWAGPNNSVATVVIIHMTPTVGRGVSRGNKLELL